MWCRSTRRLVPFPCNPPHTDRKDGHVVRGLDLPRDLIQVNLAEAVEAGTDQDDVLVPFDLIDTVERVIESVEQIGLSKTGYAQLVQPAINCFLLLGEIHQRLRLN